MRLDGKIALVTGASRGIGRAVAIALGKAGAKVGVNYASSAAGAEEVVCQIAALGGEAVAIKADVADSEQVKGMFADVERAFGGSVDILVNNAGITKDNLLVRMSDADFDAVLDINLKGAFYCMRAAGKVMMKKRYGKIINISSVVGFSGNAGQANYAASKAGLHGMTRSVALELGGRGVRVNTIAPGFISTDMTDALNEEQRDALLKQVPLGSLGKPEDVAHLVVYLSGAESDYITGQVIHINGGMY